MTITNRHILPLMLGLAASSLSWTPIASHPAPKHSGSNHRAKKPTKKARKAQREARRKSRR